LSTPAELPILKRTQKYQILQIAPREAATPNAVLQMNQCWEESYSRFGIGVDRSERAFRGFLPRKTTPRDFYGTTVIAKPLIFAIPAAAALLVWWKLSAR
jgi:hypothetical protein